MEKKQTLEKIEKLLVSKGMKKIKLASQKDGPEDEGSIFYGKIEKSNLYLVDLVDASLEIDKSKPNQVLNALECNGNLPADYIFVLHLFVGGSDPSMVIGPSIPEIDRQVVETWWLLDDQGKELSFGPGQVESFLNLEKDLANLGHHHTFKEYLTEHQPEHTPYFTYALIGLNILVWILEEVWGGSQRLDILLNMGAMNPYFIVKDGQWYRMVTALFLHIGLVHLLMNIVGIYIFGLRLEQKMSWLKTGIIYLIGGLAGNLVSTAYHTFYQNFQVVSAGASSGVYALMGGLLAFTYFSKKKVGGLDAYAILLYFIVGLIASAVNLRVDLMAHLGGFVGGLMISLPFLFAAIYKQIKEGPRSNSNAEADHKLEVTNFHKDQGDLDQRGEQ